MRVKDLINRLNDRPFRGFRIHLSDGSSIPVTESGMIVVGPSSAVLPTDFGREDGERVATRWRTVALAHMVQFSDLDEPCRASSVNGRNRAPRCGAAKRVRPRGASTARGTGASAGDSLPRR